MGKIKHIKKNFCFRFLFFLPNILILFMYNDKTHFIQSLFSSPLFSAQNYYRRWIDGLQVWSSLLVMSDTTPLPLLKGFSLPLMSSKIHSTQRTSEIILEMKKYIHCVNIFYSNETIFIILVPSSYSKKSNNTELYISNFEGNKTYLKKKTYGLHVWLTLLVISNSLSLMKSYFFFAKE